jgi:hypothetical protein
MGSQYAKPPLEPFQFARNGQYPDSFLQGEMADLANKIALYRGKEYFSNFAIVDGPTTAVEEVRWRFACRASPYANAIGVYAWLAQHAVEDPGASPYVRLRMQDGTPTTLGDVELHYGLAAVSSATPNTMAPMFGLLKDGNGDPVSPVAGTDYYGTISEFQGRVAAISVFELTLNATVPFREGYAAGSSILDLDRQELVAGARLLWKQGAGHLFNWNVDKADSPRTRTSATSINVIDNSSTAVSAATPGFTLDLRNRTTVRRTTVPVVFKVYASSPGLGSAILRNSAGAAVATIANISAAGWYSAQANLPATLAKYDAHIAGDGTNAISCSAMSLYQSATGL